VLLPALVIFAHAGGGWGLSLFLLVLVLAVFGCVLLHELGHALMARRFGIPTRDITLYPIGGVARLERMSEEPTQELLIALAGPAVNVVIVLLLLPLCVLVVQSGHLPPGDPFSPTDWLGALCRFPVALAATNLGLVIFNLLPIFPMDGGRVLRALLAMAFGLLRATEIAAVVALFLAGGLGLMGILFGQPWLLLIVLIMGFAGQQELAMLRRRQPQLPEPAIRYSGYTYDADRRLWILWQDGKPVAVHWPQAE
jgi:stage IV sporulation protein FB